jgi:dimethylargininase
MFAKAIVRPPAPNFAEGLTTAGLGAPDYQRALNQHEAYCAALEWCGLTLIRLDAEPNYPDSCFVEDTAIVVNAADSSAGDIARPLPQVVLTRPGAPSRAGEVERMRGTLNTIFSQHAVQQIQLPGTLDGGDVCEAGKHYFIGLSMRTNESGAQQLAQFVAARGYTSSFVDIRARPHPPPHAGCPRGDPGRQAVLTKLLHLKSGLAYVGDNRVVVTEALAGLKEFDDYEVVLVPPGAEYAANCVRVNDYVLVAAGYEQFEEKLRNVGYQTLALDMSEFQKMDGGLSCLSLRW